MPIGFGPRNFGGPPSMHVQSHSGTYSFVSGPPLPLIMAGEAESSAAAAEVELPEIVVGIALLDLADRADEGQIVRAITPAWINVIRRLRRDLQAFRELTDRQLEELIAGGYREEGWEVILTPRSGDGGIDVIAMRPDFGGIRVLDQAKRYAPGNLVPANDVRAMLGVLQMDSRASKGRHLNNLGLCAGGLRRIRDGHADPPSTQERAAITRVADYSLWSPVTSLAPR